jgi:hypothetical protein
MSQGDKDKYIARYIALAPPYLGTSILTAGMIGYADNYVVNLWVTQLGIDAKMFKDGFSGTKGIYNLMPKDTINKNRSSSWAKAILARIQDEKYGGTRSSGTIMDIFPKPTQSCNIGFKSRGPNCKFDLFDTSEIGAIGSTKITSANMGSMLKTYGIGYQE